MQKLIHVIGYAPRGDVDRFALDDYQDFPVGRTFEKEDFEACLKRGVLAPGLACLYQGHVLRVSGGYGYPQQVEVWCE